MSDQHKPGLGLIFPAQCPTCCHIYLEKYEWPEPREDGEVGFCWCGWCRKRRPVYGKKKEVKRG